MFLAVVPTAKVVTADLGESTVIPESHSGRDLVAVVETSESQREIFAAIQAGGETANLAFNESITLLFEGDFSADYFHRAVLATVARHDALRSTFSRYGTQMCIHSLLDPDYRYLDATIMADADVVLHAEREKAVREVFDLLAGPLLRVAVIKLSPVRFAAVITAHHIICDGWSMAVLLEDMGEFYSALVDARPAANTPPVFYLDYLQHMRTSTYGEMIGTDLQFWNEVYADTRPELNLPLDFSRPAIRTFNASRCDRLLGRELITAIKKTGAANRSSFVATLLASFSVFLNKISDQTDVVVGMPAAGQSIDQRERLIGHCVNTLPIRCSIDPTQSFVKNLHALRDHLFETYDHQRLTFGTLVQQAAYRRDRSRVPLVSVLYNIDQGIQSMQFSGLQVRTLSNPRVSESFEIFLNAVEQDGCVLLECQFNTDLYRAETIGHWLHLFESLLEQIVADPTRKIDDYALAVAEDSAVAGQLNDTAMPLPGPALLHDLFEQQVVRSPAAIATQYQHLRVSYAELESRANRIARWLDERGVAPGAMIGVALSPSDWLQPVLLGVLKHGSTYVPIDPQFPIERIRYMIDNSALAALIHDTALDAALVAATAGTVTLDELVANSAALSDARLGRDMDPESPAYVIYTSGSTGKPKGVVVKHQSVVNYLMSMAVKPGFTETDVILAATTLSFDIAVTELFLPLITGGSSVLIDREMAMDGDLLREVIEVRGVTVFQATPSSWRLLLSAGWGGDSWLKALCGGESLPAELIKQLLPKVGELWNMYGPTETTVWSTCHRVESEKDAGIIGRPLANTMCYVMNDHFRQVSAGVIGELYIGGQGVAAGYLKRADLTAERFIDNPFGAGKLYRTGDLVRLLGAGVLQYQGRVDFQVKIRGYRIELGEIESALEQHPAVNQALVVAHEFQAGDSRLVAYLTGGIDQGEIADIRSFLRTHLPAYMIPQHFVPLEAFPMTPNLKVDRNALPVPVASVDAEARLPASENEQFLAAVWRDVLKVEHVLLEDNFFDIGGHSLTAVDVIRRVHAQTGYRFEVREFIMETLEQLAVKLHKPDIQLADRVRNADAASPGSGKLSRFVGRLTGRGQE